MKNIRRHIILSVIFAICACINFGTQMYGADEQQEEKDARIVLMVDDSENANVINDFIVGAAGQKVKLLNSGPDYKVFGLGPVNEKTKYFIQYKGKEGKGFQKIEFTISQITGKVDVIGKPGINFPKEWKCITSISSFESNKKEMDVSNRKELDNSITFFFNIGVNKCPLE